MKLFKLPYLVQKELFYEMDFSTRYFFTFGTRRMKIWAKRLQNTLKPAEVQVEISDLSATATFTVKSGKHVEKVMDIVWSGLNPDRIGLMKIGNSESECKFIIPLSILPKRNYWQSPTNQILESLCDFINTTKEDVFYILNCFEHIQYFLQFPIQKSVLRLTSDNWNSDLIDHFFSNFPHQNFFMVEAKNGSPDHVFFFRVRGIRNLILTSIEWVYTYILTEMQGENVVIRGRMLKDFNINNFLRLWLNRESDDRKTLIVEVTDPIQGNNFFEDIPHTKEEKSVRYPYNSIIQDYCNFPEDAFDCSNTYTIFRNPGNSNEKKATVKLTSSSFMFFVWD